MSVVQTAIKNKTEKLSIPVSGNKCKNGFICRISENQLSSQCSSKYRDIANISIKLNKYLLDRNTINATKN